MYLVIEDLAQVGKDSLNRVVWQPQQTNTPKNTREHILNIFGRHMVKIVDRGHFTIMTW